MNEHARVTAQPAVIEADKSSATASPPSYYAVLTEQAEKVAARNAEQADKLRSRAGDWGKALAAAMTTALGWITFTRATDIFPPGNSGCARTWAVISLIVMAASIVLTWVWFNLQTRPVAMGLDIDRMRKGWPPTLNKREAKEVARLYGEFGDLNKPDAKQEEIVNALSGGNDYDNGPASAAIQAYAISAVLLERDAQPATDTDGKSIDAPDRAKLERAAQIRAEVYATQQRAGVAIVRRRVGGLLSGLITSLALIMFVGGLVGLSYSIDAIDHARGIDQAHLTLLNECAKTAEALSKQGVSVVAMNGVTPGTLPGACDSWAIPAKPDPMKIADILTLSDSLSKCRSGAPAGQPQPACDDVAALLQERVSDLSDG